MITEKAVIQVVGSTGLQPPITSSLQTSITPTRQESCDVKRMHSSSSVVRLHSSSVKRLSSGSVTLPIRQFSSASLGFDSEATPCVATNSDLVKSMKDMRQEMEVLRRENQEQRKFMQAHWNYMNAISEDSLTRKLLSLLAASERRLKDEIRKEVKACKNEIDTVREAIESSLQQRVSNALAAKCAAIEGTLEKNITTALEAERTARVQEVAQTHVAIQAAVKEERVARLEAFASLSSYLMACRLSPVSAQHTEEHFAINSVAVKPFWAPDANAQEGLNKSKVQATINMQEIIQVKEPRSPKSPTVRIAALPLRSNFTHKSSGADSGAGSYNSYNSEAGSATDAMVKEGPRPMQQVTIGPRRVPLSGRSPSSDGMSIASA